MCNKENIWLSSHTLSVKKDGIIVSEKIVPSYNERRTINR
mgnify:CR=1 FL=1